MGSRAREGAGNGLAIIMIARIEIYVLYSFWIWTVSELMLSKKQKSESGAGLKE